MKNNHAKQNKENQPQPGGANHNRKAPDANGQQWENLYEEGYSAYKRAVASASDIEAKADAFRHIKNDIEPPLAHWPAENLYSEPDAESFYFDADPTAPEEWPDDET